MIKLPKKSPVVWERFFNENRSLIYLYITRQIRRGIKSNAPNVSLFMFGDHKDVSYIEQKNYLNTLETIMKYFILEEEYENAETVNTIIKQYYIDKLIQESISGD
jgi:hypothetical protein